MDNKKKSFSILILFLITILYLGNGCQNKKTVNDNHSDFYLLIHKTELSLPNDTLTLTWFNKYNESFSDTLIKQTGGYSIQGKIPYPVKGFLESTQSREYFPFVLHNDTVIINLTDRHLYNSKIERSDLNKEWQNIVITSEKNYKKINYLFPKIQKARLENNHQALEAIYQEIENIKNEQKIFLLDYVENHSQSKLNPIILNDLYLNYPKDSLLIKSKVPLINETDKIGLIEELLD